MNAEGRRRAIAACAALALVIAIGVSAGSGSGAGSDPAPVAEPVLGPLDLQSTLMGAVTEGAHAGEVWAYRPLPLTAGDPVVDGAPLELGQPTDPRDRQLAFLRYTSAGGWQVAQTPVDENGQPYRGMQPNELSARISPSGGGVLVGEDRTRSQDGGVVVLQRDPGGRFGILPGPPAGILQPGESLAGGSGAGRVVDAVADENGHTGVFLVPIGRSVEDGVVHFDGSNWSREPIDVPDPQPGDSFEVVALAAAGPDDAWLLARPDPRLARGLALFRRTDVGGSPHWVDEGDLGTALAGPDAQPLEGPVEPLTATTDGVWVDGQLGGSTQFTFYYDAAARKVTGSWCDAPGGVCDHPLGAQLSTSSSGGYRSFAWAGDGFGTRIVTNPLTPSGREASNRGTYLSFDGDRFRRMPGGGYNGRRGGAFASADEGWLAGPVHVTRSPEGPGPLRQWPLTLRAPLAAVASEPGAPRGAGESEALAVGADGGVVRYTPGRGWIREYLLTSTGAVSKPTLRGVAWPDPTRAYAVGDLGAMWQWRSDTGLWEKDPGAPIGFEGNLVDVAFDPSDPERGYAVGRSGTLLRYDKSWDPETLPAGFETKDLSAIAFAGTQALVAAGSDLLVNDGGAWHVDQGVHDLLASAAGDEPQLLAVSALPDGGAVTAGRELVIERDRAGAPWRYASQPLSGATVSAVAAVRPASDPAHVHAVVAVVPRVPYPLSPELPPPDPNVPPPILPAFPLAPDGYVLRETASGWRDEQHSSFGGSGIDRPIKAEPVLAFDLSSGGEGWAVGGWSGEADSAGRGSSGRNSQGREDRRRVETAAVYRYGGGPAPPEADKPAAVPAEPGMASFAIGAHAQCAAPCADLANQAIAPDRTLARTIDQVRTLAGRPGGPRFFAYAGGRLPDTAGADPVAEEQRYAELLAAGGSLPVYGAASERDSDGGTNEPFRSAFAAFAAPFGTGGAPAGITPAAETGAAAPGARTHYAFDSDGPGGIFRTIVIDNSLGSLAASDPIQNPAEPQLPWLEGELADAKAHGLPAIVIGSRDLNSSFRPRLNLADDADVVARALVAGGASAYFYERPEENRALRIPAGSSDTIPEFGTGTLGYRSPLSGVGRRDVPDALFGDTGFLIGELDVSKRDAATNRAPVSVRLIPTIDDLSMDALDGTLLRRSHVALFTGLARRPLSGDRWGDVSPSDNNADPAGGDPYTPLPPALCQVTGCSTRITPEYSFSSSDDDIGDFVQQDPASTNPRKVLLDAKGKAITDSTSGLFCAFNAGTTTVTIKAGGLSFSEPVTVQAGSVERPCGTRPLKPERFGDPPPGEQPPPPPPTTQPQPSPPLSLKVPPPAPKPVPKAPVPPKAAVPPPARPRPAPKPPPPGIPVSPPLVTPASFAGRLPSSPTPPQPTAVRPIPPGGAVARVYQVEEKREEELATEESAAFSAYHRHDELPPEVWLAGAALIAALAGATIALSGSRGRGRPRAASAETSYDRTPSRDYRRRRS